MIRVLISLLLVGSSVLTEVTSYAKVSRNGQEEVENKHGSSSWIPRAFSQNNETENEEIEGRSAKDIVITVSPVYVAPKTPKLRNGEAVDYSPRGRYSTLDHELIAQLDAAASKKQIQDRYHPSPLLVNNGQSNGMKQQMIPKPVPGPSNSPGSDSFEYSKPSFPDSFDYKPQTYFSDKPISKPITADDYPDSEISDKPPDSYKPTAYKPDSHEPDHYYGGDDHDFSEFPPDASYGTVLPKPIEFSGHLDHPPYDNDDSFVHDHDHDYHHEVIYDHIPEYHDHPHDHTEEPEMNDQRLDKRPYSYYYIGKKLWYVPLYFSIYFIIYIAALVLKSIARHKINFPSHLEELAHSRKYSDAGWWDLTGRVLEGIENFAEKFGRVS